MCILYIGDKKIFMTEYTTHILPRYHHPSEYRIDNVLFSAMSMGARVVRSHSLGISTGGPDFHGYGLGWKEVMIVALDLNSLE